MASGTIGNLFFRQSIAAAVSAACSLFGMTAAALGHELPAVADVAPVSADHFPNRLHAAIWRNWQLVEPAHLAPVLGATVEQVTEIAASMGLPRDVRIPPEILDRGYITLIRRNWHLMPYDQLVQLLKITPEDLAFRLREDDFLFNKLGSMKPRCARVEYREPTAAERQRAAEIKAVVLQRFGDRLSKPGEPRFGFIANLSRVDGTLPEPPGRNPDDAPRFIYSYFAVFGDPLSNPKLDPYPDGLLARLRDQGVNGIWMHTVLRQLAPGGTEFPEFGAGHEERLANLRKLVGRAKRFGIDIYLYMNEPRAMPKAFYEQRPDMAGVQEGDFVAMCTSDPRVRQWVSDSLAHIFREVPGLGGVFTITASENLTNCATHGHSDQCPRCKKRPSAEIIAEINTTIAEGVHRTAPKAKVIVYDWSWSGVSDVRAIIDKLPNSAWLLSVSEWSLPIERGGVQTKVGEYSISAVGPGPQATQHWKWAKQRGLKTVAKVQFNNTWELSSVPYLPVLDLVAEHCDHLAKANVDGLMLSWSLGGYPSMNLDVAQKFSKRPAPDRDAVLNEVANRHFGSAAAPHVRAAWTKFSKAFREFPFHIETVYNGPQHWGPANLLYEKPTGYHATMIGFPYDDLKGWRGPYPSETYAAQFAKIAEGWNDGLKDLEKAQSQVSADRREACAADLRVARAAQLHFASVVNQARFVIAREALAANPDATVQSQLRDELAICIDGEIDLVRRLYDLCVVDSRIGYEASNHYYYVPLDLVEKVVNCEYLRTRMAPRASDQVGSQSAN